MSATLLTPIYDNHRRDLKLNDPDLVKPDEADALEQGEWVIIDPSTGNAVRPGADGSAVPQAFMVWSERGDYSAQALGRVAVIFAHEFEVETDIFVAGTYTPGDRLTVELGTVDSVSRGAVLEASTGDYVHGIVTKDPTKNGGKLRFRAVSPFIAP